MPVNSDSPQLLLASASPRRAELLRQIAIRFTICSVDIDESPLLLNGAPSEAPEDYVNRLSLAKAQAACREIKRRANKNNDVNDLPVLGSDTCVVLGEQLLGKPLNKAHAIEMLQSLSGQIHHVMTSVSLVRNETRLTALSVTEVEFRELSLVEIERYVESGEPEGKAGAYAIQGFAAVFIKRISGSYSGVMGLPLAETYQLLQRMDVIE